MNGRLDAEDSELVEDAGSLKPAREENGFGVFLFSWGAGLFVHQHGRMGVDARSIRPGLIEITPACRG